jgi:hypothetical protein
MVSAWPELPSAKPDEPSAGVCAGKEALALCTSEPNRNWRLIDHKSDASSRSLSAAYEATKHILVLIALVFVLHSTKFYGPWHDAKDMYRVDAQPLLLIGAER